MIHICLCLIHQMLYSRYIITYTCAHTWGLQPMPAVALFFCRARPCLHIFLVCCRQRTVVADEVVEPALQLVMPVE